MFVTNSGFKEGDVSICQKFQRLGNLCIMSVATYLDAFWKQSFCQRTDLVAAFGQREKKFVRLGLVGICGIIEVTKPGWTLECNGEATLCKVAHDGLQLNECTYRVPRVEGAVASCTGALLEGTAGAVRTGKWLGLPCSSFGKPPAAYEQHVLTRLEAGLLRRG